MDVRPESLSFVQRKVEMAQTMLKLIEIESQSDVLKCVDALHTEGKGLHEFYLTLHPFNDITLTQLPLETQYDDSSASKSYKRPTEGLCLYKTRITVVLRDLFGGFYLLDACCLVFTDIKPVNVGLINLKRDLASQGATYTIFLRQRSAVSPDINSAVPKTLKYLWPWRCYKGF